MLSEDLLSILRCPLNPSQARLVLEGEHLTCAQCRLRFPIKDGFPVLIVEEAELPAGCESTSDLPCQKREGN
ncbi:MAG: hypothetical protein L0215_08010 [Gemmataceae bacterium]|nr:hypothetical protein [Gemmataceae bacterium]